jgi:hypothetical protein
VLRVITLAIAGSYPEIPDNCLGVQLLFIEDVLDVLVNRPDVLIEQLGHHLLREPDRLILQAYIDPHAPAMSCSSLRLSVSRTRLFVGMAVGAPSYPSTLTDAS